jgi:hypothetical protein
MYVTIHINTINIYICIRIDYLKGALQADFANKFIGGGVLERVSNILFPF